METQLYIPDLRGRAPDDDTPYYFGFICKTNHAFWKLVAVLNTNCIVWNSINTVIWALLPKCGVDDPEMQDFMDRMDQVVETMERYGYEFEY